MNENIFKRKTIKEIEKRFPGSMVIHLDPTDIQGIPDILILYKNKWAALEFKKNKNSNARPNQSYYISLLNTMSYASFIYPENKEEIMDELQKAFRFRGPTRFT